MASGTGIYKRIIQLLEKWPIDETKQGRDLSEFLQKRIHLAYKQDKFSANHKYWDSQYISLQRLINNEHKNKYPRVISSSATGLTAEQCNFVLSNEFLKQLQEEDEPFYKSIFKSKNKEDA